jgi:hypothetical protein
MPNMSAKSTQGQRPVCGLCRSWKISCEYATPAINQTNDMAISAPSASEPTTAYITQRRGMDVHFITPEPQMAYPTPPKSNTNPEAIREEPDVMMNFHLPPHELLVELVDIFFNHLSPMFPCFHHQSFRALVHGGKVQKESPLILYAICCVAARCHSDISVRRRQNEWYEQAKFSYQLTQRNPYPALRTIQAALLLIHHANTAGDYSSGHLFLGKVWGQAVTLGMSKCCCCDYERYFY